MRLLVECSHCHRQYDATDKPVGSRFRCHCGTVVTVKQPKGRDAAVVQCSACGAPRNDDRHDCGFCESDFTIHERDLNTVCPRCLARVSDDAQYCHHCGTGLVPESVAGDQTPHICPACGEPRRLTSRHVGQVAVMECPTCAGFWLGNEAFEQLIRRASLEASGLDTYFTSMCDRPPSTEWPESWRYRRCVDCDQWMHRRHYGVHSGVIIDVCMAHGIWFDVDELPRILSYVRSGEKDRDEKQVVARAEHAKRLAGNDRGFNGRPLPLPERPPTAHRGTLLELLATFFLGLLHLKR